MSSIVSLLNKLPINIVIYRYVNNDFIFIDLNKMAEKTEKLTKSDIIGKPLTKIFPKVKEFGLFELLVKVHDTGVEEELDISFYEDERVNSWRHNTVNRLENGDILVAYTDMRRQKDVKQNISESKEYQTCTT
ncbi:MAG: hypothetical protein Q9M40_03885 [Sulfurimonas sp.]|nr:hypothetical protein [Sulfurimonas sp.]